MRILMVNASPKKNGATEQVLQWMKEALEERYETESVCLGEVRSSCGWCGETAAQDGTKRRDPVCGAVLLGRCSGAIQGAD